MLRVRKYIQSRDRAGMSGFSSGSRSTRPSGQRYPASTCSDAYFSKAAAPAKAVGWVHDFDEVIALPDGRQIITLIDAAIQIPAVPKKEADSSEWQTAIEALSWSDLRGPTMFARIAVMRALNRNVERAFNPNRQDRHWGKQNLKRDL